MLELTLDEITLLQQLLIRDMREKQGEHLTAETPLEAALFQKLTVYDRTVLRP